MRPAMLHCQPQGDSSTRAARGQRKHASRKLYLYVGGSPYSMPGQVNPQMAYGDIPQLQSMRCPTVQVLLPHT